MTMNICRLSTRAQRFVRISRLWGFVACLLVALSNLTQAQIAFDVNPLVAARDASALGLNGQIPNSRMVDVQFDVSALFQPGEAATVTEYTVRITSRHEDVLVADYSPRTELYSEVLGNLQVAQDAERMREASLRAAGGYPGAGSVYANAYSQSNEREVVQFSRKPAMELLTASGTIERRKGVYFKVKQSPQSTLEGARPFRIIFEVPQAWRADLLDVAIDAVGFEHPHDRRSKVLTTQRFVVACYQENDMYAANASSNYIRGQEALKLAARTYARSIEHRSYPTPIHKLGAKLDLYEPSIPQNWLEEIVYQSGSNFHMDRFSMLPVDVRVAIMNYLDHKELVENLAASLRSPSNLARNETGALYVRH